MEAAIEVTGLRKRFGPTVALDGMSFTVAPGEVTGFVGPNGAGKTTTMRVILGLDAPEAGTAVVAGYPYRALRRPLTRLGSLLDATALQPSRPGRNHLLWLAHSQGLAADRVDAVRDSAVAIGSVLGLLYLFPILAQVAVRPGVARHLEQIGPMTAGLEIQASTGLRHLPIGPWAGLGVLAAWAAAALLAGALVLRVRDA